MKHRIVNCLFFVVLLYAMASPLGFLTQSEWEEYFGVAMSNRVDFFFVEHGWVILAPGMAAIGGFLLLTTILTTLFARKLPTGKPSMSLTISRASWATLFTAIPAPYIIEFAANIMNYIAAGDAPLAHTNLGLRYITEACTYLIIASSYSLIFSSYFLYRFQRRTGTRGVIHKPIFWVAAAPAVGLAIYSAAVSIFAVFFLLFVLVMVCFAFGACMVAPWTVSRKK